MIVGSIDPLAPAARLPVPVESAPEFVHAAPCLVLAVVEDSAVAVADKEDLYFEGAEAAVAVALVAAEKESVVDSTEEGSGENILEGVGMSGPSVNWDRYRCRTYTSVYCNIYCVYKLQVIENQG
ncbi:hypothetical protein BGX26_005439 [Mortierella sp. AD094]|nr:hypothetical protein BGX26_005439 [Mortierella sp. AD094]